MWSGFNASIPSVLTANHVRLPPAVSARAALIPAFSGAFPRRRSPKGLSCYIAVTLLLQPPTLLHRFAICHLRGRQGVPLPRCHARATGGRHEKSNGRRKARRSSAQRNSTAYHEASHPVIGRVLTCLCGGATIKPRKGRRAMPMPASAITNGKRRGKMRGTMAVYHAQIMVKMAGRRIRGYRKNDWHA